MDGTGYMEPLPTTGQIAKALVAHRLLLDEHLNLIEKTTSVLQKQAKTIEELRNAVLASNIRIKHLEDTVAKHEVAIKLTLDTVYPNI